MVTTDAVYYLEGEETGEVLHAFFQEVTEWLRQEKFAKVIEVHRRSFSVGKICFCPSDDEVWELYYENRVYGKDEISNAIVLAKPERPVKRRRGGFAANQEIRYVCRFFQCDLADPNLWERTVNALRAFRYSHWPK